ncbi:MAG: hypothetical protein ABI702_11440 [Burkholderiales bacterium]
MHHRHPHRDPAPPCRLRIGHPLARVALGVTVAIAVLSAGVLVFAPFSGLSVQRFAASELSPTSRAWRTAAEARQAAASSPIARLARREAHGP